MLKPQHEQNNTAAELANAENKSAELSADELRAISGGATGNPAPPASPDPIPIGGAPKPPTSVSGGGCQ
jgi:hypothetical protein